MDSRAGPPTDPGHHLPPGSGRISHHHRDRYWYLLRFPQGQFLLSQHNITTFALGLMTHNGLWKAWDQLGSDAPCHMDNLSLHQHYYFLAQICFVPEDRIISDLELVDNCMRLSYGAWGTTMGIGYANQRSRCNRHGSGMYEEREQS